jgi:signal transduction histidine kinase
MINLRHIEAGQVELEPNTCDVAELVRDVAGEFQRLAESKRQTFTVHLPDAPVEAVWDADKIRLALANIISNAVKFTPEEGKVDIILTPPSDDEIAITVRDTGIGIEEKDLKRIFDRFYQAGSAYTRQFEGMGLGLSIAKSLVEIHHGRIDVESAPGKGSTFTVRLPRRLAVGPASTGKV